MKNNIYDMVIYDEIDIYTRDGISQGAWTAAQQRLMSWFKNELTDSLFFELLNMKEFKNQNGKIASQATFKSFKEFMTNYYIENKNLTQKSYDIVVKYAQDNDEFRYKTDIILKSPFLTEEIFNYALDSGFLGTDKYKWYNVFHNKHYSNNTLKKFLVQTVKSKEGWSDLMQTLQLSKNVIDEMLKLSKNDSEIIVDLAQYGHHIDEKLFLDMVEKIDLKDSWSLTGEVAIAVAIKKMILKDKNFYEEPDKWDIINNKTIEMSSEYRAIIYSAILTYPDVNNTMLNIICKDAMALGYILRKSTTDISEIDNTNKVSIFEKTKIEAFLPQEVKDIFIF